MAEPESDDLLGLGIEPGPGTFLFRLACYQSCLKSIEWAATLGYHQASMPLFVPAPNPPMSKYVRE